MKKIRITKDDVWNGTYTTTQVSHNQSLTEKNYVTVYELWDGLDVIAESLCLEALIAHKRKYEKEKDDKNKKDTIAYTIFIAFISIVFTIMFGWIVGFIVAIMILMVIGIARCDID